MSKYKVSEEEKTLFRQAVSKIRPPDINEQPRSNTTSSFNQLYLSDAYPTQLSREDTLFYTRSPLAKTQLENLKRGKLMLAGQLDLHGHTTEEAKLALIQFLEHQISNDHRLFLIIHGKGQIGANPHLKNLVNHWLKQIPAVLAFVSAQPKDGGTGAVYVLLKTRFK